MFGVNLRPRSVRKTQDGEDFALHLPALLAAQPPLDEAGTHFVVRGDVWESDLRGHTAETA